jgi:hypothetical protein
MTSGVGLGRGVVDRVQRTKGCKSFILKGWVRERKRKRYENEYTGIYCRGVCLYEKRVLSSADFWSCIDNARRRDLARYGATSCNAPYWPWRNLSSTWWRMSDLRLHLLPISLLGND